MVAWWVVGAWILDVARAFCPPGCSCNDTAPSARCVGGGINVIPILFNPGLRRLNLAHNAIKSLDQTLVFLDKLEELDLSHNLLTSIDTGNFEEQSRLRELSLANNNFTALSPGAFSGLAALSVLDLSHNSLSELPVRVLDDLPHLTVLNLGHNRLHMLSRRTFRGPHSLLVLDLCDNYFRDVPTEALEDLLTLQKLHLCRNRLTRLEADSFPTDTLVELSLETNSIDAIEDAAFARLRHLRTLDLACNLLADVPTDALASLLALEALYLSRNKLRAIQADAFRGLGRLRTLDVSRNPQLSSIHGDALRECASLQSLTISNSPGLRRLPEGFLSSLVALHNLDLRANGLEGLPETDFDWGSLKTLDLRDNPLVCNCSLQWLAYAVSATNSSLAAPDLQCANPEKLRGLYLSRLVPTEQLCGESVQVVVAILVVSGAVVLGVMMALLLCRYWRRQKRQKLSTGWPPDVLGPPWSPQDPPVTPRHVMTDDYTYQAPSLVAKVPVTKV